VSGLVYEGITWQRMACILKPDFKLGLSDYVISLPKAPGSASHVRGGMNANQREDYTVFSFFKLASLLSMEKQVFWISFY